MKRITINHSQTLANCEGLIAQSASATSARPLKTAEVCAAASACAWTAASACVNFAGGLIALLGVETVDGYQLLAAAACNFSTLVSFGFATKHGSRALPWATLVEFLMCYCLGSHLLRL